MRHNEREEEKEATFEESAIEEFSFIQQVVDYEEEAAPVSTLGNFRNSDALQKVFPHIGDLGMILLKWRL